MAKTLLDIALACVARGWYVFPCPPGKKVPRPGSKGLLDAVCDEAQVRRWWASNPNYNPAIACGPSDLCVVDVDTGLDAEIGGIGGSIADLQETLGLPMTYGVRTGRRPDYGHQLYFRGATRTTKLEVRGQAATYTGDIKSLGGYVLAAGSLHPSGAHYKHVCGSPDELAETPDAVRNLVGAITNTPVPMAEKITENRIPTLLRVAGKLVGAGLTGAALAAALHAKNEADCEPPLEPDEVEKIVAKAAKWDGPADDVEVIVGAERAVDISNDAEGIEGSTRPRYPDEVWDGTAYGEFADICSAGNFIPRKFFSESFRTVVGALVGDRLRCTLTGVNPRAYTIKIAPPGSGKGTSDEYVRQFFCPEQWEGLQRTELALLWSDPHEIHWRSRGIGAQSVSPASAPGLIKAIEMRRLKKGEVLEPMEVWKPIPRIITMSEEVRGLFANFANESTGAGLESVLCELFDRDSFTSTATKDRGPASGRVMYSLLGGITREGWDSVFSKTESVESGFLSRVSVVGTEETRTTAGIRAPDFTDLQSRFLPRLQRLEENPIVLDATGAALACMDGWFMGLQMAEGISSARLNVLAWRTALHLAWLHEREAITETDVQGGIAVATFQARMREFYAPPQGITRAAQCEAAIRRAIRSKRRVSVRELRRATHGSRWGIGLWDGALQSLVKAREVRMDAGEKGAPVVVLLKSD